MTKMVRARRRGQSRKLLSAVLLVLSSGVVLAEKTALPKTPPPPPTERIAVEPLGFEPPPRFYMPYRFASATLDFLDANHLLFTFHVHGLMRRDPDENPDDQDMMVKALVLSLPGGKVTAEASWRLHDRGRYVWMLGDGRFLLRERNTIYRVDAELKRSVWMHQSGDMVSLQTSPDGSFAIAQYAKLLPADNSDGDTPSPRHAPTLGADAPKLADSPRKKEYTIAFVDTRKEQASMVHGLPHSVSIPVVEGGFIGLAPEKSRKWQLTLQDFHTSAEHRLTTVDSTCQPVVSPVSQEVFLVTECVPYSPDQVIEAYDLRGNKLWTQHWQTRFIWGNYSFDNKGKRFAYGSTEVDGEMNSTDPVDNTAILSEPIGVFDTETGKLNFVLDADPILTAGQNFALSPDGNKFAVLRKGVIEVYDLPPATTRP